MKNIIIITMLALMMFPVSIYGNNEDVHKIINDLKKANIVENTEKTGKEMAKDFENYELDPVMFEKAKGAAEITKTDEFKERMEKYQKETMKSIEQYVPAAKVAETEKKGNEKNNIQGLLNNDERLYVLVSTSMPKETIRKYLADINKIGDPNVIMVLRGVPGGARNLVNFRNTIIEQWSIKEMDLINIQIDPLIFRAYSIDSVPAIIYASGLELMDIEQSEGWSENAQVKDAYIIHGDVSLEYAIESIYQRTGNKRVLDIYHNLKRSFYDY